MQEWVIFRVPELLLMYGGGLLCFLVERAWHASRGVLTWLGGALVVGAAAWSILRGASLWEAAAALTAFLLLMMEEEK